MPDLTVFPGAFKDTREVGAIGEKFIPACSQSGIEIFFVLPRPIRKEHAFFLTGYVRHELPYFFGRKGQNRRRDLNERIQDDIHGRLRTAAGKGAGLFRIYAILGNIEIDGAEIDGAEVMDRMVHNVELVVFIRFRNRFENLLQPQQRPFVDFRHIRICYSIRFGIKIIDIAEKEPEGIAYLAIHIAQLFQDFR